MSVKIISYDLGKPETSASYKNLIDKIKSFGASAKPLESFWLVDTTLSCVEIRDQLKSYLDQNDRVFVVNLPSPLNGWASYNLPKSATDWLQSR